MKPILDWRDFFVSYTNRYAPSANYRHRALIRSKLGKALKAGEQTNYVATVISRHLRRYENLQGFFDYWGLIIDENIGIALRIDIIDAWLGQSAPVQ